jgi:inhibitor of KinA sporulation pathway (predicted exonuclease)
MLSPPAGKVRHRRDRRAIIEIGLCVVDVASLQRKSKRSILVKPSRSEIGPFCTDLTGLTPSMFTDAVSFAEATRILKKEYDSKDRLWASWGDYDRRQFERQCAAEQIGYPFGTTHLNVKSLFATSIGHDHELGLDGVYSKLGLTMEGRHHRGVDDAWNIAEVLIRLLRSIRSIGADDLKVWLFAIGIRYLRWRLRRHRSNANRLNISKVALFITKINTSATFSSVN